MNELARNNALPALLGIVLLSMLCGTGRAVASETVSLQKMLDRVIETYPSIEIAALQVEQARQEFAKVRSTLGWQVYSQAGIAHDLNFINSPTDRFDVSAGMRRSFESGSQFEIAGQYAYAESDAALTPFLPNPSRSSGLDIKYRMPFARGRDNAFYRESLLNAEAGLQLEKASQVLGVDNLVQQAVGIFFDAANAYQRLQDARSAIDRAKRLKRYIERNYALGLAEDKDILGIEAQLTGAISRYEGVALTWKALRNELNRLMNYPAGTDLMLEYADLGVNGQDDRASWLDTIYKRNPGIAIQEALANIALTNINITRDRRKEQLDLVLSAGARYGTGSTVAGSYSQDEIIGSAVLEYRFDLDQQGFDAEYYQSLLRYEAANRELQRTRHDLQYALDNLLEQLEVGRKTLRSYEKYVALEERKLEEAISRYREGRSTTNELIDFENDLNASKFAYNSQKIELTRVQANIKLLLGELWDTQAIEVPARQQHPEVQIHD